LELVLGATPYQTIIAVHEEELRKRVTPKPYEEYMLGLSRYLGKAADEGKIAPQQLVQAFNAGWNYMVNAMKNEAAILATILKPRKFPTPKPGRRSVKLLLDWRPWRPQR
jgi:hypothetical protein